MFFKDFIYLFLEKREVKGGMKRGREASICERNMDQLHPNWGLGHSAGMCPDQELNW